MVAITWCLNMSHICGFSIVANLPCDSQVIPFIYTGKSETSLRLYGLGQFHHTGYNKRSWNQEAGIGCCRTFEHSYHATLLALFEGSSRIELHRSSNSYEWSYLAWRVAIFGALHVFLRTELPRTWWSSIKKKVMACWMVFSSCFICCWFQHRPQWPLRLVSYPLK